MERSIRPRQPLIHRAWNWSALSLPSSAAHWPGMYYDYCHAAAAATALPTAVPVYPSTPRRCKAVCLRPKRTRREPSTSSRRPGAAECFVSRQRGARSRYADDGEPHSIASAFPGPREACRLCTSDAGEGPLWHITHCIRVVAGESTHCCQSKPTTVDERSALAIYWRLLTYRHTRTSSTAVDVRTVV